jgi:hypothetical protein
MATLLERNNLTDRFVDVKELLPSRRFRDKRTDTPDDSACSLSIAGYSVKR